MYCRLVPRRPRSRDWNNGDAGGQCGRGQIALCILAGAASLMSSQCRAAGLEVAERIRDEPIAACRIVALETSGLKAAAGDQTTAIPWNQLVRWGKYRGARSGSVLQLTDGSLLVGSLLAVRENVDGRRSLLLDAQPWGELEIGEPFLRGFLPTVPMHGGKLDQLLDDVSRWPSSQDGLWSTVGDSLTGRLAATADSGAALFGVAELWFRPRGSLTATAARAFPADRIRAVAFASQPDRPAAPGGPVVWLGCQSGTLVAARDIQTAGDRIRLTLACGAVLEGDASRLLDQLALAQPVGWGVTYLSDLTPVEYRHQPYLDLPWELGIDRAATGNRLRIGDEIVLKGLGMHAASRVVFALGPSHERFVADLAIDSLAGDAGSIVARAYVRDAASGEFAIRFASTIVRGGDPPAPVSFDVHGGSHLALLLETADHGDAHDHGNWLTARLLP